jgi:hypothetical protein
MEPRPPRGRSWTAGPRFDAAAGDPAESRAFFSGTFDWDIDAIEQMNYRMPGAQAPEGELRPALLEGGSAA